MTNPTPAQADQWRAIVLAETKRCGHALLALLHCKRSHPELWAAVNGQRAETRQMELEFEQQDLGVIERQK